MRVLLTPRKWVQIKPSRRHAEARVGPESDRHTGPESDCHRQMRIARQRRREAQRRWVARDEKPSTCVSIRSDRTG